MKTFFASLLIFAAIQVPQAQAFQLIAMPQAIHLWNAGNNLSAGGINVVGNGGGFAEMLAETANANMTSLSALCLQGPGCGLSANQKAVLQAALQKIPVLHFQSACTIPPSPATNSSILELTLPSCLLYVSSEGATRVRAFDEIAAIVMRARIQLFFPQNAEADAIAEQVFSGTTWQETPYAFDDESERLVFWNVSRGASELDFLAFETESRTLDLTPELLLQFNCPAAAKVTFNTQFDELDSASGVAKGQVDWRCETQSFSANLTLVLQLQNGTAHPKILLSDRQSHR